MFPAVVARRQFLGSKLVLSPKCSLSFKKEAVLLSIFCTHKHPALSNTLLTLFLLRTAPLRVPSTMLSGSRVNLLLAGTAHGHSSSRLAIWNPMRTAIRCQRKHGAHALSSESRTRLRSENDSSPALQFAAQRKNGMKRKKRIFSLPGTRSIIIWEQDSS